MIQNILLSVFIAVVLVAKYVVVFPSTDIAITHLILIITSFFFLLLLHG